MTGRHFEPALLDEVRSRTSLVRLIGRTVKLTRKGRKHVGLCPFHSERTPSFVVNDDIGWWRCYGCGEKGDAIAFVMRSGVGFVEAIEELAADAGVTIPGRPAAQHPPRPVVARPDRAAIEAERERTIEWARRVWRDAKPAAGTLVPVYLASRGIHLPPPPTLRFAPSCRHVETGSIWPAMVAAVQDRSGQVTGVHRTFLRPDGAGKAKVGNAKKMGGECWRGAVRFTRPGAVLRLAEGIETALSIKQAIPDAAVWAALSIGNLVDIDLPDEVREVRIFADADNKDPAAADAVLRRAAERHARDGRKVSVAWAPDGHDFNDVLRRAG